MRYKVVFAVTKIIAQILIRAAFVRVKPHFVTNRLTTVIYCCLSM